MELWHGAQEIADLVVVKDSMLHARVGYFLGTTEPNLGDGLLPLLFNRDIRNYLRKFVFVRIVLAVAHLYPRVICPSLQQSQGF